MVDPAQILETGTTVFEDREGVDAENGSVELKVHEVFFNSVQDGSIELVANECFLNDIEVNEKCADSHQDGGTTDVLSTNNMAEYGTASLSACESFLVPPAEYLNGIGSDAVHDVSNSADDKKVEEWLKGTKVNASRLTHDEDDDPDDPASVAEFESLDEVGSQSASQENAAVFTFKSGGDDFVEMVIKTQNGEQKFRIKPNIPVDCLQSLTLQQVLSLPVADERDELQSDDCGKSESQGPDEIAHSEETPVMTEATEVSIGKPVDHGLLYTSLYNMLGRKSKVFPCPIEECNQVFNKECKLKIHLLSHEDARPFKCKLEGCDWAFNSFYRLKRHLLTHIGRKDFICDEPGCNSRFTTVYNLNSHKDLHKRQNSFACRMPGCDERFPTRRKMELHLKDHSDIEAPYKCPVVGCGKNYYSANFLASHLRVHQYSKDDLKCPFPNCGKFFLRLCQLKQHLRQHTGERPYACDHPGCGWTFSSASKLTRHTRKHTGDRRYVCPEADCGKSFMRPEHLKGHMVIHTGVRPFQCPYPDCQISFTAKSSLYVHMKKHKGQPQKLVFACPIASCTKKYSCKASLKQHLVKMHTNDLAQTQGDGTCLTFESSQKAEGMGTFEGLIQEATSIPVSVIANGDGTIEIPETTVIDTSDLLLQQSALGAHFLTSTGTVSGDLLSQQLATMSTAHLIVTPDLLVPTDVSAEVGGLSCRDAAEMLSKELPESTGGSARTDYCSNLILSSRAKRRRLLQQQFKVKDDLGLDSSRKLDNLESSSLPESGILSSADVVLSSAIALPEPSIANQFAHTQLLQDDPPTSDIDHLLNTELPVPLLVESSVGAGVEFATSTINLQDLE